MELIDFPYKTNIKISWLEKIPIFKIMLWDKEVGRASKKIFIFIGIDIIITREDCFIKLIIYVCR